MKVVGALNNDMIGWANDDRLDNTIRYSNAGIRDIQHAAAMQFSNLITYDALYYKNTDAAAYYEAYGDIVGGIGSYPVLGNPHYHQSHDLLEGHQPSARRRSGEDDRRNGDAAGLEPVAIEGSSYRQRQERRGHRVVDAESRERRDRLPRGLRSSGKTGSAAASRRSSLRRR